MIMVEITSASPNPRTIANAPYQRFGISTNHRMFSR